MDSEATSQCHGSRCFRAYPRDRSTETGRSHDPNNYMGSKGRRLPVLEPSQPSIGGAPSKHLALQHVMFCMYTLPNMLPDDIATHEYTPTKQA